MESEEIGKYGTKGVDIHSYYFNWIKSLHGLLRLFNKNFPCKFMILYYKTKDTQYLCTFYIGVRGIHDIKYYY